MLGRCPYLSGAPATFWDSIYGNNTDNNIVTVNEGETKVAIYKRRKGNNKLIKGRDVIGTIKDKAKVVIIDMDRNKIYGIQPR